MTAADSSQDLLPADLTMGTVMLKVGDMKLMTDYYQRALGLDVVAEQDGGLYLGRLKTPLVHLAPAPGLHIPGRGEAGLFHTALLFGDQSSLAATIASAAPMQGWGTSTCRWATSSPPMTSTSAPWDSKRRQDGTARPSLCPPAATTTTWP